MACTSKKQGWDGRQGACETTAQLVIRSPVSSHLSATLPWHQSILRLASLLEAEWPQKFLGLLLHIPLARKKETSLAVTLEKTEKVSFPEAPPQQTNPAFHWLELSHVLIL